MDKKSGKEDFTDDFRLADSPWNETTMGDKDATREMIFTRLRNSIAFQSRRRHVIRIVKMAAVLLALIVPTVYFILNSNSGIPAAVEPTENLLATRVKPGGDKAQLVLGDGTVVLLEKEENGTIGREGNVLINKNETQLIYQQADKVVGKEVVYNTISTPRGGQFQVILPDGSKVWLNAESSLRFPTSFIGTERQIELIGEGYFEITPDDQKPFKVITEDMAIEVLGTHFNVKAYRDEEDVQTTLLEGKVKINTEQAEALLVPGQEAHLMKGAGDLNISQVDPDAAIAWKNGYFQFEDEHLYSIMRKLARWYDVEVVYHTEHLDKNFTGYISRYEQITDVLKMLELTGVVHFQIEERRIIVTP